MRHQDQLFEQREITLLDAARQLLTKRPSGRVTIAEVASAAGIGKGTAYKHVPSKEALYARLTLNLSSANLMELRSLYAASPVQDAMRRVIRRACWQARSWLRGACTATARSFKSAWSPLPPAAPRPGAQLGVTPNNTLPILKDGEQVIGDSTQIALYLEQRHPNNPLLPADAAQRAEVLELELEEQFDRLSVHVH